MSPVFKHLGRGAGYFLLSISAGMAVYDTYPESLDQLGMWIWKPFWNGLYIMLGSLGLNQVIKSKNNGAAQGQ